LKRFDIVVRLEDGSREVAGALAMGDPAANGRYTAEFRYEQSWLKSVRRFYFGDQRYIESRGTITDMARRWGTGDPIGILRSVLEGLSQFKDFARLAEVPEFNVEEIEKDLTRRTSRVADGVSKKLV
jgi:hypothetical protein